MVAVGVSLVVMVEVAAVNNTVKLSNSAIPVAVTKKISNEKI